MSTAWLAFLAAVIVAAFTAGGAIIVARIGARANRENTAVAFAAQLNARLTAVEGKLHRMENYQSRVNRWWHRYEHWITDVLEELEKLDPGALARLGSPPGDFPLPEPDE